MFFFPISFFPPLPLSYICSFPEGRWQFIQEYMLHVPFPKVFIYSCSFEYGSRCYRKCGFPEGSIGGRVVPTKIRFWGPGICWVLGVLHLYLDRFHHRFRAYIPTNEGDFTMHLHRWVIHVLGMTPETAGGMITSPLFSLSSFGPRNAVAQMKLGMEFWPGGTKKIQLQSFNLSLLPVFTMFFSNQYPRIFEVSHFQSTSSFLEDSSIFP